MQLYLLALALLVLAALLVLIVVKTISMIRQRRAWIALGPVQWQGWARTGVDAPLATLEREAECGGAIGSQAGQGADVLPRARRRQLLSARDGVQSDALSGALAPGFYQTVEGRLETAFAELQAGTIDLARYSVMIDAEYETALRLCAELGPLADETLHAEANDVIAALRWCRSWADEQALADERRAL